MTIDAAAIRLTDAILGEHGPDLEQTLKAIAANIGVLHIAYACARGWPHGSPPRLWRSSSAAAPRHNGGVRRRARRDKPCWRRSTAVGLSR
jgi:hypothetical protein